MAEYINIKGQNIEVVASDPANPTLGQIWYNSTSNTLKGLGLGAASWASGGSLSTARRRLGGAGTQTAGLAFAGGGPNSASTEEYNGTAWTGGGNLSIAREGVGGCGIQTAALAFGGEAVDLHEMKQKNIMVHLGRQEEHYQLLKNMEQEQEHKQQV
jgi:hypothetical protein